MRKRTQDEKDPAGGTNRGGSGSGNGKKEEKRAKSSMWTLFMHADTRDAWLMALGAVGAVGDGLVIPIMFFITNMILNNLGSGPSASPSLLTARINQSVVNLVYLACCSWVVAFFEGYCWTRTGERQASRMRMQYMKAILRQDVEYFDLEGTSTADVIVRISSDSLLIQNVLSEKVPSFITNIATFIGCYAVGFILLWRLALVASPTVVLLVVPAMVYGKMQMSSARKARAAYSKADAIVEQAVSSIRTVYSFVGEGRTIAGYSAALGGSLKHGLRQGLIKGVAVGGQDITLAIWALLAWYGSRLIMYHGSKGGSVFIVGACINMGGTMLGTGLSNVKYFSDAITAHERIEEVIRRVPKIDVESVEGEVLESTSGEVEFRGVEFTYPSRPNSPILMGFSLKVPTGATVALVGGSGSGKSTVIALLERFYDPDRGEILLDGVDIRKLVLKWLRSQMALVSQEPTLFSTSIRENVLFGKEDASMEEVVAAAKAANAHDFISQLPQGYETQVGERGAQLSGGQKQRIAIARATIKSPRILLLDEATSALDSGSEWLVQEALDRASAGRTTIVVAHRLSTIRNADAVAVVQTGQVVEIGSHDDLMCNTGGPYSTLVHLQQATATTTATKEEREQTMGCVSPSPAILDDSVDLSPSPSGTIGGSDSNTNGQRLSQETRSSRSAARVGTNLGDSNELPSVKDVHRPGAGAPSLRRPLSLLNASEWKHALAGCAGAVVFGGTYTFQAFFMGSLLSVYFKNDNSLIARETRNTSFIFLSLCVLSILTGVAQHYGFGAAGEYLTKRVREQMLSKILTFEVGWFDREENSTGAICSRLNKDAYLLKSLVGDQMSLLVQTLSVVAVAFTVSLVISWRYAVVIIAVQPVLIGSYYSREVLLKSMSGRAAKLLADSSKLAAEAVSEISTVAAFSSQDRVLRLYGLALDGPRRESIRQSWIAGLGLGTSQFLVRCTWALTFWYGGRLMSSRDITSKAFFQTYLILLLTARMIAEAGTRTSDLAKGAGAVGSILALLGRATLIEPDDPAGLRPPEKLSGRVEFRGVDFAYPSRPEAPVLRAFSLTAEAGRSTAIVGRSGSGKSTVVALVERFYDPARGCVRIDGVDVRSYRLRSLRRRVALVGQQPALFSGSVRENIAYGAAGE